MVIPIRYCDTPVGEKRHTHWLVESPVVVVIATERSQRHAIPGVEYREAILVRLRHHE